jgi:hypothetical protein
VGESFRLHDVEAVLYLTPEDLVAILAYQHEVREHLLEGVELVSTALKIPKSDSSCPHSWETE